MKKLLSTLSVFFLLIGIGSGCQQLDKHNNIPAPEQGAQARVQLYYGDVGNQQFQIEEREIIFPPDQDRYSILLQELIKGTDNTEYRNNIDPHTVVYGNMKQNSDLIVNLSQDFNRFGGSIQEIIAVGSIVNTLNTFDPEIKRVKILVEGEELIGPSGNPRGFMEPMRDNSNN
ncbi:MAG: GerMN domain-containing protein [Syntrophomonadaceae bacterium]|jgi:germination protein M|nr:GerMN domain-containing protein [Syntrophomonadaceae bacterium]